MSYARSPRPVCSITIGTSIPNAPFRFLLRFSFGDGIRGVARLGSSSFGRRRHCGNCSAVEEFHRLLLAQAVTDSTETAFANQTLTHLLVRLMMLLSQAAHLRVHFLVGGVDVLELGDAVEHESGADVALGGFALAFTQALE